MNIYCLESVQELQQTTTKYPTFKRKTFLLLQYTTIDFEQHILKQRANPFRILISLAFQYICRSSKSEDIILSHCTYSSTTQKGAVKVASIRLPSL